MCGYNVNVSPPGQFVHPDAVKQLDALAHQHDDEGEIEFLSNRDFTLDVYFSPRKVA